MRNLEELKELTKFMQRTGKTENFIKSLKPGDIAVTEMDYTLFRKAVTKILGYSTMPVNRSLIFCYLGIDLGTEYEGIIFIDVKQFILFMSKADDELKREIRTRIKVDPEIFTDYISKAYTYPENVSQENINKVKSLSTDLLLAEIGIRGK